MRATTSKTTPKNPNENSKENEQIEGQGIDAKGLRVSPAKDLGNARNTQMKKRITRLLSGMTYREAEYLLFRLMDDLKTKSVITVS